VTLAALAGCATPSSEPADATVPVPSRDLTLPLAVSIENLMNFTQSVVTPAVGIAVDLYEEELYADLVAFERGPAAHLARLGSHHQVALVG
jgi:hypothetical protein